MVVPRWEFNAKMPKYQNKGAERQMTLPHLQWLSLLLGFSGSKFPFNHVRNYEKKQHVQRDFQLPHPTPPPPIIHHQPINLHDLTPVIMAQI
jgi:hypothetical protein